MYDTVLEIAQHLKNGGDIADLGRINRQQNDNLVILNYGQECMFSDTWNKYEMVCRGLIVDVVTGEVAALPFPKFFNWGQGGRYTNARIKQVFEKADGSLGILYRQNGQHKIATRGSFESEQAVRATRFLNENYDLSTLDESLTLLFEIIYPENRIVVDYGNYESLVVLGAYNRFTGEEVPFEQVVEVADFYGFDLVNTYNYADISTILSVAEALDGFVDEGFVVLFEDGQRFKIKGSEYLKYHRIMYGLSEKLIVQAYGHGKLDVLFNVLPDEFRDEVQSVVDSITTRLENVYNEMKLVPAFDNRKEVVVYLKKNHPDIFHYYLAAVDNKDWQKVVLVKEFGFSDLPTWDEIWNKKGIE